MNKEKILQILDKHIDQEGLAKDLALEMLQKPILEFKAKIESGEIDLIKSTDIEKVVVLKVLDLILEQVK